MLNFFFIFVVVVVVVVVVVLCIQVATCRLPYQGRSTVVFSCIIKVFLIINIIIFIIIFIIHVKNCTLKGVPKGNTDSHVHSDQFYSEVLIKGPPVY